MYKNSSQRFREIVKVLAYYGFGFLIDSKIKKQETLPQNLRKAFEELGPTFVKIGQILSTRPDILPREYIFELTKLQDNVIPEPFENINKVFLKEFNREIEESFLYFDKKPLASASIAQVHKAVLKDGRKVIVKVQRPDIAQKMHLDLSILYKLAKLTKARFDVTLIDPIEAIEEITFSTKLELDFRNEAKNINKFSELNKEVAFLYTPYIIDELSSTKVLVLERIDGFKIDNLKKFQEGEYDLEDVSKKLTLGFLKQVFNDGFFHGDPHPGNILIRDGKICFIDFGIMGNLTKGIRDALNDAMIAVAFQDINKLIGVFMSIGIKKGYIDRNQLYEDIDYLFANYLYTSLENLKISFMLQEVFETAKRNNIQLPKDLTLVIRSFVIIEGVITKLNPSIKIIDIAIPFVKANNKMDLNFNLEDALLKSYTWGKTAYKVPSKIVELADSLLSGRAKVQLEHKNLDKPLTSLNKMVNRMVFGLVVSSLIIGSSLILNSNIGPKIYGLSIIGVFGFFTAGIMGLWLLISILKSGMM